MSLGIEPKTDADGLPVCSPGLRKLLLEGDNAQGAARLIAQNPTLRAEAERVSAAMLDALNVDVGELIGLLEREATSHHANAPNEESRAVHWNAYFRELQTVPLESVAQAFKAWNRGDADTTKAKWSDCFPTPSQVLGLARAHQAMLGQIRHRLRLALDAANALPREIPPEEKAAVAAGLRDLAATFAPKALPEDVRPKLTPQQVAAKLRAMSADEDVVI